LTAIDVFSKRAWAIPLKTKTSREVASAFERILGDVRFNMVQTDKGTEFMNVHFQRLTNERDVHHYASENEDIKASVVEQFNRTLKDRMHRYFSAHQTRRYLDVLDNLVYSYNNTRHRSIGMAPSEVTTDNEQMVREWLTKLPRRMELDDGEWKVCLREISTPLAFINVPAGSCSFVAKNDECEHEIMVGGVCTWAKR